MQNLTLLHKPDLHAFERGGIYFFIDAEAPNWIATDNRGAKILEWIDGQRTIGEVLHRYIAFYNIDWGKGWRDTHFFFKEVLRKGIVSTTPVANAPYPGRADLFKPTFLREFWIHLLQTCNLSCTHCLVSSNPQGDKGPETSFYMRMIDEAADLGVRRFYFTGGEPFLRNDIFDLIQYITEEKKAELIILTNATLFEGERLRKIQTLNRERLRFQVSLDGTSAKINDPIRGKGVFHKTSRGLRTLSDLGLDTALTAVVTRANLNDLANLPVLAKALGAGSVHLIWPFQRGEVLKMDKAIPSVTELLSLARTVKTASDQAGIVFDNMNSIVQRVNGQPGVKYDLGNLCWESLCLYSDGQVYPSAALAGIPQLALGDAHQASLRSLWIESPIAQRFRKATLADSAALMKNPFRFLTGGGDMEQSYCLSQSLFEDPYHDLSMELVKDAMVEQAIKKRAEWNEKSGFNPPRIYHAMGNGAITCSEDALGHLSNDNISAPVIIRFLHTNCVLSFDVEKPYKIVQNFYGHAAIEPQKELCCPVKYDDTEVGHIPQEVLDRFYGCGSPMAMAGVRAGETVLDLGSGAGIDCFIAAKKVGPQGRVIGVDMTDPMLKVANESKQAVSANLGYDVVEFRKGYLEKIPVENKSVDLVTSNCVINLSPDKSAVFAEIWRVLKNNGRMVVADIVSDTPVPLSLQAHPDLWGECISGALSEEEFMTGLEKAGVYGISLLKKTFWKEVEGHPFYSITVRGFKFEKREGCQFIGQRAIYWGPFTSVMDEEGHLFPRGEAIEVCTDTAARLSAPPYDGCFTVVPLTEGSGPTGHVVAGGMTHVIASTEPDSAGQQGGSCC